LQLYLKIHCGKAKHFAIRENQDVEGTINLLQSYELAPQSIPEETPVTAALAREQRSRGRKDKDRGRDSEKRGEKRRTRSKSPESRRNSCWFCGKIGHLQKECRKYLRAKERAQDFESSSESEDQGRQKRSRDRSRDKGKGKERRVEHAHIAGAGVVSHFDQTEPYSTL
jgi:hypothetical protein